MQTFPYSAFRITPSFYVEAVTLVSATRYGSHVSDKGKWYAPLSELFQTKEAAIEVAFCRLTARQTDLEKRLSNLPKLFANLDSCK